jgi:hypothetical protein
MTLFKVIVHHNGEDYFEFPPVKVALISAKSALDACNMEPFCDEENVDFKIIGEMPEIEQENILWSSN